MPTLKQLEATIRNGQQSFFAAAKALLEIDRKKLWKPEFRTIVEYAEARFDFSTFDVTRYRNAGVVLENLAEFDTLPVNEAQCRELAKLRHKDPQCKVWAAVLESNEKITARLIASTAQRLLGGAQTATTKPEEEPRTAIQEIVQAVLFVQAARHGIENLDDEGRQMLTQQMEVIESEIQELRTLLAA